MSLISAYIHTMFARVSKSERGATAVEYGIMVALIAVVIIVVVTALGGQLNTIFQTVVDALTP